MLRLSVINPDEISQQLMDVQALEFSTQGNARSTRFLFAIDSTFDLFEIPIAFNYKINAVNREL
jgi:hypothetical protein